jgi:hypothetical protein
MDVGEVKNREALLPALTLFLERRETNVDVALEAPFSEEVTQKVIAWLVVELRNLNEGGVEHGAHAKG